MVTLKGKLVTLRPQYMSDAKELFKRINNYKICRWFSGLPWPITQKYVTKFLSDDQKRKKQKQPNSYRFIIIDNVSRNIIGCANLHDISYENKHAETGTWLVPEFWGKGLNSEIKILLLNFGFKKLKLHKITLSCASNNKKSMKAIEKLNAKPEGILRDNNLRGNKYYDTHIYSILKKEWKPSKLK